MTEWFTKIANTAGVWTGHPMAFIGSVVIVVVWAVSGPLFGFSDTWQLFINTGTTVVTYLLVFVIQNSANRNAAALHLKLDELLRALEPARTELVKAHLEQASEKELQLEQREIERLAEETG